MKKNLIRWTVEGCSVGDTIKVYESTHSTTITVTGFYDRYLLGRTRNGSPKSINYSSLYSDESKVYAINVLTLASIHVTPDSPACHIRCREKRPVKKRNDGNLRTSGPSSGLRPCHSGGLTA